MTEMKKGRKYNGYNKPADEAAVRAHFTKKFGYPPDEIFENYGVIWAGPIDESQPALVGA